MLIGLTIGFWYILESILLKKKSKKLAFLCLKNLLILKKQAEAQVYK
jgi:hypothetical protein